MKENSIEEDIKDLKKYISFSKKHENFSHDTDYKWHKEIGEKIERVLKENEELKEEIEECISKKRIKDLLREAQEYDLSYKDEILFDLLQKLLESE